MRTIEVVDYQPHWPDLFDLESQRIADAIASLKPAISHIGSTSVPGLSAKPVIDILVEVDDVAALDAHNVALHAIGYIARGENGIPERRYFEKGGADRTHQIHAFNRASVGVLRHLAFRDYLVQHPKIASVYGELKKRVAIQCDNDIVRYCAGKDAFIQTHEKLALAWVEQRDSNQSC